MIINKKLILIFLIVIIIGFFSRIFPNNGFFTVFLPLVITPYLLHLLIKSSWFRKKFMNRSAIEEIESIERIEKNNILHEDHKIYKFKTEMINFVIIEIFSLGVGLFLPFILIMAYFEKPQFTLLQPIGSLIAAILIIYGFYGLFLEAIKIKVSPDSIELKRVFRSYLIDKNDINKVIFYYGGTSGFITKKYFAAVIVLKTAKKYRFRLQAMSQKNTEKILDYFRSNFKTEEIKRFNL